MENYDDRIMDVVTSVAKSEYYKNIKILNNVNMNLDEYISLGVIGFKKAIKTFNPKMRKTIEAYSRKFILHEIRKETSSAICKNQSEISADKNDKIKTFHRKDINRNSFMCIDGIFKLMGDELSREERRAIEYRFCDDITPYKIARKMKIKTDKANIILRNAKRKIKSFIGKRGKIKCLNDIRTNLAQEAVSQGVIKMLREKGFESTEVKNRIIIKNDDII